MTFFYNLNKKLDSIREKPETTHKQLNERDEGKPGKNFAKIAKDAGERYGSKAAGERVAGAVRNKLKAQGKLEETNMDESAFQAAIGKKKYGEEGMKALQKAGRDNASAKTMSNIRNKYDKYDEGMMGDVAKKVGGMVKRGAQKAMDVVAPGDEALLKDLQKKVGVPQTGQKPRTPLTKEEYGPLEEKSMTPKQKSFAKLAPPADKITFADKIAGAKKEVDEMLGDVAAEAMKGALRGGQKKLDKNNNGKLDAQDFAMLRKGGKQETDEGWDDMMKDVERRHNQPKVGSVTRGHKHDIETTATGRKVTRRVDDQGMSVGADDDTPASGEKRGRGRPKGSTGKIGAKGPSGKSKLMTKEAEHDSEEIKQAMAMLKKAGYRVEKAEQELDEKAVSVKQRRAAGIAHAAQKGEIPKSKLKGASKEMAKMPKGELHKFAATKEKDLPEKKTKKKEEVEETTVSGSVATSDAAPKSGGKGGMTFGKGIYDSMNRELEKMIAEGMNVSMNMNNDSQGGPSQSLTVTATDEDAMYLGKLLKMAGLGGQGGEMSGQGGCPTCGSADCGCGDVQEALDENQPDWPTDEVTSNDALQYAGGLNKPKTTVAGDGQTTVPVTAVQVREEAEEELDEQEQVMAVEENEELDEALRRIKEMAGIKVEAKKVKEDDVEEGNKFTGNLAKARAAGKDEADLDGDGDMEKVRESVSNLWKAYKG
jgi:hypothetical protein